MQSFGIVPAAGRSSRMGTPKLLLPWGDKTLIASVLQAWRSSRVARVVAVVHPEEHELARACARACVEVVQPAAPPPDIKASVRAADSMPWAHKAHHSPSLLKLAPSETLWHCSLHADPRVQSRRRREPTSRPPERRRWAPLTTVKSALTTRFGRSRDM